VTIPAGSARAWRGRLATGAAVALAAGAVALVSSSFLIGSTPDEEEFRFAILTSWLHVRALLRGDYALWSSALGLGIPLPMTPNFLLHPLLPLLAVLTPVTWVRVLLLAHTLLGAAGMWRVGAVLGLTPLTRAACVTTFLLATPTQNYVLNDFWPSHYMVWTAAPWLLVMAWRMLDAEGRALRRWSIALGLSVGLVVANTNPGHVLVYVPVAVAVALTHARRFAARWRWVAAAGLIAAAIAGPNLAQLAHERPLFDANLARMNPLPEPLPPAMAWQALLSPLSPPQSLQPDGRLAFTRTLSLGSPFALLSLIGCVWFVRRRPDLVLVVIASTALLFTPLLTLDFISARFQFRDPLTLAAIPLAGLVLDRLFAIRRARSAAGLVLVAQVVAVVVPAWPVLSRTWGPDARRATWFRGSTGDQPPVDRLLTLMPTAGRLALAPQLDEEVYEHHLVAEGFGTNALAYRGVAVINGWFKGVSTGTVWPDEFQFYARVHAPAQLVESDDALDVLGVRYVLANTGEMVAPGLSERGVVPKLDGSHFVLYENSDPWPDAFVINEGPEPIDLAARDGCDNQRLLCRDFSPLVRRRSSDDLQVTNRDGRIDIQLSSRADAPRLLVVSQMFRPDWVATADGLRLVPLSVFGGLLGVRVPPGITSVRLRYWPVAVVRATALAWCVLLGGVSLLVIFRGTARGEPARPPRAADPAA
jgi:hypothetical protein